MVFCYLTAWTNECRPGNTAAVLVSWDFLVNAMMLISAMMMDGSAHHASRLPRILDPKKVNTVFVVVDSSVGFDALAFEHSQITIACFQSFHRPRLTRTDPVLGGLPTCQKSVQITRFPPCSDFPNFFDTATRNIFYWNLTGQHWSNKTAS